ncbi:hypothetical protein [Candidatus Tisiphia endosymbiont of Oplodontha viridula]
MSNGLPLHSRGFAMMYVHTIGHCKEVREAQTKQFKYHHFPRLLRRY